MKRPDTVASADHSSSCQPCAARNVRANSSAGGHRFGALWRCRLLV